MSSSSVDDSAEEKNSVRHRIRSFVLRQGRMTAAQERGLELLPQKGLFREHGVLDCEKAFGRSAPTVLEIGFGMGASLLQMAQAAPHKNFIGIEVHRPGVGKLLHDMVAAGVDNIRVYCDDAVEILQHCIADDCLDAVQIFFPDPWHKKRHHKRRLIQPEFVALIHRKLKTSGVLHAATDWQDYAEHILSVMRTAPGFRNCADSDYAPRPEYRPKTKFEQRGERLGHGVWDIIFSKIE